MRLGLMIAALALIVAACGGGADAPNTAATQTRSAELVVLATAQTGSVASPSVAVVAPANTSTTVSAASATATATDVPKPTSTPAATDTTPSATDTVSVPATAGGRPVAPVTELADGPVTVVSLGDSLTAGEGDEEGLGFVGDLTALIDAAPGRSGSTLVNLGVSGWDSTMLIEGGWNGEPGQLDAAVAATTAALAAGRPVLATVLIGSNDMWYLYDYDGSGDEDAAAEVYRANLERTVRELTAAGAVVVVGLPDDQSLRPVAQDIEYLHTNLPYITEEKLKLMSAMSDRLGSIAAEIATKYGARIVDTNAPLWANKAMMAPDLIHPNSAGYAALAKIWFAEIEPLLRRRAGAFVDSVTRNAPGVA